VSRGMRSQDIRRLHRRFKVRGSGPIGPWEATYILAAIEEHRPRRFLEVGTSSGLSTGLIANMLHDNEGAHLVSVDASARFYRDDAKPSGFLVPNLYEGDRVDVELRSPRTSIDVASWDETFDMGFVDGHHGHPWPLIDLLCIRPRLGGSQILFQHDLNLYKKQRRPVGIGPKYLFDQFPESHRTRYAANQGNLFSVSLDMPVEQVEAIAIEAFPLPWTTLRNMEAPLLQGLRDVLRAHYSPELLDVFETSREKFAVPTKSPGA